MKLCSGTCLQFMITSWKERIFYYFFSSTGTLLLVFGFTALWAKRLYIRIVCPNPPLRSLLRNGFYFAASMLLSWIFTDNTGYFSLSFTLTSVLNGVIDDIIFLDRIESINCKTFSTSRWTATYIFFWATCITSFQKGPLIGITIDILFVTCSFVCTFLSSPSLFLPVLGIYGGVITTVERLRF